MVVPVVNETMKVVEKGAPPTQEEIIEALKKKVCHGQDGGSAFVIFNEDMTTKVEDPSLKAKKWRLSSMSKSILTVAVCKYIEKNKLSLDDPVEKFIPAFKDMKVQEKAPGFREPNKGWRLFRAAAECMNAEAPDVICPVDGRCPEYLAEYLASCLGLEWVDIEIAREDGSKQMRKGFKKAAQGVAPETERITGIPGCRVKLDAAEKKITIRQLMTHTSGLGYGPGVKYGSPKSAVHVMYDNLCKRTESKEITSLSAWVDQLAKCPLLFQPGSAREYSYGMDVVGRVLEVISGKTLDKVIDEEVLKPAGMTNTGWVVSNASDMVPLYHKTRKPRPGKEEEEEEKEEDEEEEKDTSKWNLDVLEDAGEFYVKGKACKVLSAGGGVELVRGGMVGTLEDFLTFVKGLAEGKWLKPDTYAMASEVNHLSIATNGKISFFRAGWGWNLFGALRIRFFSKKFEDVAEKYLAGCYEWGGFAGTRFQVYPKLKGGFVFMRNSFGFRGVNGFFDVAMQQLAGATIEEAIGARRAPPKNNSSNNWNNKNKNKGGNSKKGSGKGGKKGGRKGNSSKKRQEAGKGGAGASSKDKTLKKVEVA